MTTHADTSHTYWTEVLSAGGFTTIPRWTLDPQPGLGTHAVAMPAGLAASLRRLVDETGSSLGSVVLAAHAAVLARLSGETAVVAGYVPAAGAPALPLRLQTDTDSWLALLAEIDRTVSDLGAHQSYPVAEVARELGLPAQPCVTIFDQTGDRRELVADVMLSVALMQPDGDPVLELRYRTDALDAEAAARIAGYHITALSAVAADEHAAPTRQSLLSAEERRFLIEGLSGPKRRLPDKRAHELFEERVRTHPNTVAAVCGERQWTYGQLNAKANQLARGLLTRGLDAEDVVAVVTERNLDWMASVLAIFKAGGVYLPIEPHFPADRIAAMLSRSDCALVLTEPGSTSTLERALDPLPGVRTIPIAAAYEEGHAEHDLGIDVAPDQLAYIYFTSGSTGEPKGAMCEHGGMLNHLFAKIDDLEIGPGHVVAQVAPQCFDISLWQLISAVLVGGRTLLIEQDVILDVERFVATIVAGRVGVLQVVPSYLEVVLPVLDRHAAGLPDLRSVSVTGEALTKKLTEQWFAAMPEVALVNAYGLTETSDDTNHEVMDRPPDGDRVPLGRAVNNVYVYVVDEHLEAVPLGAPGEIVFSGICVGRGYINDPERTALAYMNDPIRPGERLYRSGDYGRWRPDGKLEFLGRRDAQVKIRGFRIEIGDIENALLRVPDVRNGAVVVAEGVDGSQHLVAFYSAPEPIDSTELSDHMHRALPAYMVPASYHWRQALRLTGNGKVDRKALRIEATDALATEAAVQSEPPHTATERRLAAAWAEVLGIPADHIGRNDDFFDRGGTSLSAVRLAVALKREVSLKDITGRPVLADLAGLIDGRTRRTGGLLQMLAEPGSHDADVLVCFPYAGGNAVNYQPMAGVLQRHGVGVYAVELPGHDLSAEEEPFASLEDVVDEVVEEIAALGLRRVLLWGQSSGAAFAVETARRLSGRGVQVLRVFIGAQLLGNAADRRAAIEDAGGRTNAEIAAELDSSTGYTDAAEFEPHRAEHIGAAFRHDFESANRYFAEAWENPTEDKLAAPVTVVVAADDPLTASAVGSFRAWELLAEGVELYELAVGGHYFPRTRPSETAAAVLATLELLTPPLAATP